MPSDSTEKLQDAIRKLEAFSHQLHKQCLETPLKKAISLFRSLVASSSSSFEDPESILQAVEVVNRGRLLIQKLKSGDSTERSLASSFAHSIKNYNKTRDSYHQSQGSKQRHATSLFKKKRLFSFPHLPKIDLLQPSKVHYHFAGSGMQACSLPNQNKTTPEKHLEHPSFLNFIAWTAALENKQTENGKIKSVATVQLPSSLSQRSAELFQMKALTLLERYGIASNPEARSEIKQSPIVTTYLPGSPECTLSQTLTLFPGQTIVVKGSSEFDPTTYTIRKIFPESFSVSLESSQTGFPHPLQRAGWTLANELLPYCPQRIDLLPHLAELYQAKQQIAANLLPEGNQIALAKKLLKLKRHVFNNHRIEMVGLHHQLSTAIAHAAFGNSFLAKSTIDAFFDTLSCQLLPYDILSKVSYHVQELFIAEPYRYLLETVLTTRDTWNPASYFLSRNALKTALAEAHKKVQKYSEEASSMNEKIKWSFIGLMGAAFGPSSQNIILQHLSEDLAFHPPQLDDFSKKTQSTAYKHAEDFLEELCSQISSDPEEQTTVIYNKLKAQITWDITLFQNDNLHPAVEGLAYYFEQRSQSK